MSTNFLLLTHPWAKTLTLKPCTSYSLLKLYQSAPLVLENLYITNGWYISVSKKASTQLLHPKHKKSITLPNVKNKDNFYIVPLHQNRFNISSTTTCIFDTVLLTLTSVHCSQTYGLLERGGGTSCCLLGKAVSSVVSVNATTGFHIFTPCWTWWDTRTMT